MLMDCSLTEKTFKKYVFHFSCNQSSIVHLLGHLQQGLVVALPLAPPLGRLFLQLFNLLGHLKKDKCLAASVHVSVHTCDVHKPEPTFSISCLKVEKTSLLLARVLWNSSNLSMYSESWRRRRVMSVKRLRTKSTPSPSTYLLL